MSDKLQEIKEVLSNITQGNWNQEGSEIWKRGEDYNHENNPHVYIGEILRTENAEFVANAPAYVGWLIEQLEQAQADNQKLVECLEWYEDEVQYRQELYYLDGDINEPYYECPKILEDGGQRARTVLQEVQHGTSKETDSKS